MNVTQDHTGASMMVKEALACAGAGWRVLPVNGKKPLLTNWPELASTDPDTIQKWWAQFPAANIGLATGQHTNLLVFDIDPAKGGDDSLRKLEAQFGELPQTIEVLTGGGGLHYYFKHPALPVGNSTSTLGPGLDIKTDGGQVVAPPSIHPITQRAYAWEAAHHPNDVELAEVPPWLLQKLIATKAPGAPFVAPEHILDGQRNDELFRLARALKAKGLCREAIRDALHAENRVKCATPLPTEELERIVASAWTRADRPDFVGIVPDPGTSTRPQTPDVPSAQESHPTDAPESDLPAFPPSAYLGIADEIASLYAEYLEAPKEFFYIDALTFLGTLLATSVRLDSELREEPRLFTVKVARSGTDRKSSSQDTIEHFFSELLESRAVKICYGAGSAEGLQKIMDASPSTLLVYDELRAFVDKACVQQSVLLPMVSTLFHRTKYDNCTKHSEIKLTDAHLSLVAACTQETFLTMFSTQFRNIGFLNRLFVVTGRRQTRRPIPDPIPRPLIMSLQARLRRLVEQAGRERPAIAFLPDARARWSDWYLALQESPYAVRLDTYGLRFLMLFAVSTGTWQITTTLVDAVIALLDYQFAVRKELDPVDAESVVARMERLLLRHLAKGRMTESRLQDLTNVRYYGLWVYDIALKNITGHDWVRVERSGKGRQLWLTEQGREAVSQ